MFSNPYILRIGEISDAILLAILPTFTYNHIKINKISYPIYMPYTQTNKPFR
jgi:hypothetical protein